MGRAPCCDKTMVKRGPWSPEEDDALKTYLQIHGTASNWITLPPKAGLKRCGKSCRLRWLNYLRPDIKHGGFTQEEDNVIFTLHGQMGSRWSLIASHLPGRTDNDVKNYWNTKLKKKLLLLGEKTKTTPQINNNIKNTTVISSSQPNLLPFIPKSEPNNNNTIFTFGNSSKLTQKYSNTLQPMLSHNCDNNITNSEPDDLSNAITQAQIFSSPGVIIEPEADSDLISSRSTLIHSPNSQHMNYALGNNYKVEEERILMEYGFSNLFFL